MIAINKIVLLVIFLIILLSALLILFLLGSPIGEQLNWQNQLRQCCTAFRATDCTDRSIICNEETMENLDDLRRKLNLDSDDNPDFPQTKAFCNCCKTWNDEKTKCLEWW